MTHLLLKNFHKAPLRQFAKSWTSSKTLFSTLSPESIQTIKATAPVLAEHGYAITTAMYGKMLSENPDIKKLFNPSHQVVHKGEEKAQQPLALANAVHAYAANIDNLGALSKAVELIAQKHVGHHILPEHYPIVGTNLLWAIKHVLGDAATPAIMDAWKEGYFFLADILIAREKDLRETKRDSEGGWEGFRRFVVDRKEMESTNACSFYFRPEDGNAILGFLPGQYTTIRVQDGQTTNQRNYTLSKAPGGTSYRITVKREDGVEAESPAGEMSNWLHKSVQVGDVIELGVPCGDYTIRTDHSKPIVLLSGGIGITPAVAMLEYLVEQKVPNKIIMINSMRNPDVEVMHEELAKYRRKSLNVIVKTIYDEGPEDYPKGPLTMDQLDSVVGERDCHYYFCGPKGFMKAVYTGLQKWEIPEDQIHFEFFGPIDMN